MRGWRFIITDIWCGVISDDVISEGMISDGVISEGVIGESMKYPNAIFW